MKNYAHVLTLTILMASCLTSCGKKANDSRPEAPTNVVEGIQSNLIAETHKELHDAIIAQNKNRVAELLEMRNQLDLDKILYDDETLLTLAVKINHREIVDLLLKSGCKISASNARKETPLMVAAKLGFSKMMEYFIALGAKLDFKDNKGNTALHLAILNRYEEMAITLIKETANFDITNDDNYTPLRLAEMMNLLKVTDYLRYKTQINVGIPSEAAITNLIRLGDLDSLKMLFIKHDTLKTTYPNLNYYVEVIDANTHDTALKFITFLMDEGISVHGPLNSKETPLMSAVKKDEVDFVVKFLEAQVNPNVIDSTGKSALIWAIQRNSPAIVRKLVDVNAAQKYDYYLDGRKKTMKSCDVVKDVKKLVAGDPAAKAANAEIKEILDCGFLGLF